MYNIRVLCCFYCLIISTYNPHGWSNWKYFGPHVRAAAADYRQIRCRPSIPAAASKDIFNEYNNTSQFCTNPREISCSKKVIIYFIFYICLKRMRLNLSTNLPMFVYTFQAMWRHRPLEEYLVFVGIRAAYTSFSPFTLLRTLWKLSSGCPPIIIHIPIVKHC